MLLIFTFSEPKILLNRFALDFSLDLVCLASSIAGFPSCFDNMVDDGEQTQATERQPPPFYSDITLVLENKQPDPVNPFDGLRSHIAAQHPEDLSLLEADLLSWEKYCLERSHQRHVTAQLYRNWLLKNFRSLCLVENRFPSFCNTASFTWHDAFKQEQTATQQNIHLEKAAVLFNIGVTCHEIGRGYDRTTISGRRDASQEFIAAASVFSYLRDNVSSKASKGESTVDVSVECAGMLEQLMLAQAQECVCENFFVNPKAKPLVCAKLSKQVGLYYEEALNALNSPVLEDHFQEQWKAYLQLKAALFYGEACLRHEEKDNDDKAARLKDGLLRLKEARTSSEGNTSSELIQLWDNLVSRMECELEVCDVKPEVCDDELEVCDDKPEVCDDELEVCDDKKTTKITTPMFEIPSYSVIVDLRELIDANNEKLFANEFPSYRTVPFAKYTGMIDDNIDRLAGDVEVDIRGHFQLLRGLKRVNEDMEPQRATPEEKRLKKNERAVEIKSTVSRAFKAANCVASASTTKLDSSLPPVHDQLSGIQDLLRAQTIDENLEADVNAFVHKLNEIKDVKTDNLPALVALRDHVTNLPTLQEIKIADSLKMISKGMEDLELALSKPDDPKKDNLLKFLSVPELTSVSNSVDFLSKLKKGRAGYTTEALKTTTYTNLIDKLDVAYRAEDYHSCKVVVARLEEILNNLSLAI